MLMDFLSFPLFPKANPPLYLNISSPFLSGNHIDQHHAGLYGVRGAETIVKMLHVHRSVERLMLGYNGLRDDGCTALFDYLRSPDGKRHKITKISLNSNGIGDKGLWAIARYLEDNDSLDALYLQNNDLRGETHIMLRFTLAVNRSNLRTLNLTSNLGLEKPLATIFFPNLWAPRLTELHLSLCSLGPSSMPAILSFLTSTRGVGLKTLMLNGNSFGIKSLIKLMDVLERGNWSLHNLEMYACGNNSQNQESFKVLERRISNHKAVMERNRFLANMVSKEALLLLTHARPALLQFGRMIEGASTRLPIEIVMHALTFLAPLLSATQHLRVFQYSALADTLPNLGLTFPPAYDSPSGVEPPSRRSNGLRLLSRHTCVMPSSPAGSASLLCAECTRLKRTSIPVRVEETREKWLRIVGCDHFEPDIFELFEATNIDWNEFSDVEELIVSPV